MILMRESTAPLCRLKGRIAFLKEHLKKQNKNGLFVDRGGRVLSKFLRLVSGSYYCPLSSWQRLIEAFLFVSLSTATFGTVIASFA